MKIRERRDEFERNANGLFSFSFFVLCRDVRTRRATMAQRLLTR